MTDQLDIFTDASPARARKSDPRESHDAAERVNVARLEQIVLDALRVRAMTTHEIAEHTGLSLVTVSPRMAPLCRRGLVRRTGERRNGSAVWQLASA